MSNSLNKVYTNSVLKLTIFTLLFCSFTYAQKINKSDYINYLELADKTIDENPELAVKYLDSIPQPLDKTIKDHLAEYYHLKVIANTHLNHQVEVCHYSILALNHAEKEKNYDIAGSSCLELFYNLYIIKKDSTAYDYLKKAEDFYRLDNNQNGLTEVIQMEDFIEFYNNNYKKSNAVILPKLNLYRSIKNDQYYYMYALFMLTSNYIYLNDTENYIKYFNLFKNLENDSTITSLLYNEHEVTLYNYISEMHLKNKALDSTFIYLQKVRTNRQYMDNSDIENYFRTNIDYYDASKDKVIKKKYIDSLKVIQQNMIEKTAEASFKINNSLLKTNQALSEETKKKLLNRNWIITLITFLMVIILVFFVRNLKIRNKFSKKNDKFLFLQNDHDKLKAKVVGLEDYLSEIKKEFKNISKISNTEEQRILITKFYTKLHGDSTALINTNENYIEKLSQQNKSFFIKLSDTYPLLSEDEKIICYYVFTEFKNKEIAAFLNTTVRAIESKRYRIYKKINSQKNENITLHKYLAQLI